MLEGFKRLFSGSGSAAPAEGWEAIAPWAQSKQYGFRGVQNEGFVIDGRLGATPWRLEWGPSQRPYIEGQELRIRAEMGLSSELQVVVMNRALQESMEKAVFDQYVEGVQTRIDNQTPPEMRWLVMFPKLTGNELGKLRDRYAAIASIKPWLQLWLTNGLEAALASTIEGAPSADPVVLVINRGRLTLRTSMPAPDAELLTRWFTVFERVLPLARKLARDWTDASAGGATGTLQPSVWPPSRPDDDA